MKLENLKTMGPRSAQLITGLYERQQQVFTLRDVCEITGLRPQSARTLVHKAQRRGLLTGLRPGLYNLVPFELGRAEQYVCSPFELLGEVLGDIPYFLSHATAFAMHGMHPRLSEQIYVSTTHRIGPRLVAGHEFRFVTVPRSKYFGVTRHSVTHNHWQPYGAARPHQIMISDFERTILDGLRQPQYVGGVLQVANVLRVSKGILNVERLLDYAARVNVRAVQSRVGFLLAHYGLADEALLKPLRWRQQYGNDRLDVSHPERGEYFPGAWQPQWGLVVNTPLPVRATCACGISQS
jgi:predicted transcriptional regulator of viral defense system